jgi:GrpB-like predicted nucleotidyltransferase (UPF0157 family)
VQHLVVIERRQSAAIGGGPTRAPSVEARKIEAPASEGKVVTVSDEEKAHIAAEFNASLKSKEAPEAPKPGAEGAAAIERVKTAKPAEKVAKPKVEKKPSTKVKLAPYDREYPKKFEEQKARIIEALGDKALDIEHVGSTAVQHLSSKPIIDINLTVPDSADEASYLPKLEKAGYKLVHREPDWFEHRMLKGSDPDVHLHVFSKGTPELERMRVFRDRLRSNREDRTFYEQVKQHLAKQPWKNTQEYADAKKVVVDDILRGHEKERQQELPQGVTEPEQAHPARCASLMHIFKPLPRYREWTPAGRSR